MKKINNYRIISPLLCLYEEHMCVAMRSFDVEENRLFFIS